MLLCTFASFALSAQPFDVVVAGQQSWCEGTPPPTPRIAEWISVPRATRSVGTNVGVVAPGGDGRVIGVSDASPAEVVELLPDLTRVRIGALPAGWAAQNLVVDAIGNIYVLATRPSDVALFFFNALGALVLSFPLGADYLLLTDNAAMDLAADQCTLFLAKKDGTIRRLNVCTGGFDTDFAFTLFAEVTDLRVMPDGGVLVAASGSLLRYSDHGVLIDRYEPSFPATALTLTHGGIRAMIAAGLCDPRVLEIDLATHTETRIAVIQQDLPGTIAPYFAWTAALGDSHLVRRRSVRK